LIVGDEVVVAAAGRLIAYDTASGKRRWLGPDLPGSYSSPHRFTVDGITQVLLLTSAGVTSVAPADGKPLWDHAWPGGTTIVQPALIGDGDVLINGIGGTGGMGVRRLAVTHGVSGWKADERWTSTGLKPYFNDFVVHKGHAFGFDGNGQLLLLADQDLLLVLSEEGELALVQAAPDQFTEVARVKAIDGKTWNHPVLVRDMLLVRNGEEMEAFRLSLSHD
jgi:outer membrane protein assembly factor BamB